MVFLYSHTQPNPHHVQAGSDEGFGEAHRLRFTRATLLHAQALSLAARGVPPTPVQRAEAAGLSQGVWIRASLFQQSHRRACVMRHRGGRRRTSARVFVAAT